jgi:hypothetical protein
MSELDKAITLAGDQRSLINHSHGNLAERSNHCETRILFTGLTTKRSTPDVT